MKIPTTYKGSLRYRREKLPSTPNPFDYETYALLQLESYFESHDKGSVWFLFEDGEVRGMPCVLRKDLERFLDWYHDLGMSLLLYISLGAPHKQPSFDLFLTRDS